MGTNLEELITPSAIATLHLVQNYWTKLLKVSTRLFVEKSSCEREREVLTIAISRAHNLENHCIVGNRDETKKAFMILLDMINPLMKELDSRLQMLNMLSTSNERNETNLITDNKIFFNENVPSDRLCLGLFDCQCQ